VEPAVTCVAGHHHFALLGRLPAHTVERAVGAGFAAVTSFPVLTLAAAAAARLRFLFVRERNPGFALAQARSRGTPIPAKDLLDIPKQVRVRDQGPGIKDYTCGEMGECYPSGIRIQRASSHTYLDCVSTRLVGGTHHHLPVETGDGVWQAREVEGDRAPVAQHNDVVARARGVITAGAVVLWAPEALLVAGPVHEGHGFQASTHKEATAVHTEHGGGVISNWIEKHGSVEEQHATELPHMESGACWDVSGHPLGVVEAAAALHAALAHTGVVRLHARLQVVPALATVQAGVSVGVAVGAQPLVIRGHAGQLQAVQVESSGTRSWDVCTTEGVENKRHRD
jgi:hypothetical protein